MVSTTSSGHSPGLEPGVHFYVAPRAHGEHGGRSHAAQPLCKQGALSHKGRAFRLGRRKFSQLHLTGGAAHRVKAGADPLVQPLLGIGLENQGRRLPCRPANSAARPKLLFTW